MSIQRQLFACVLFGLGGLASPIGAPRAQGPSPPVAPLWEREFPGVLASYTPLLDAAQRSATNALLLFDDEAGATRIVTLQGTELAVQVAAPTPPAGVALQVAGLESESGATLLVFDESAEHCDGSWSIPIPGARILDAFGQVRATTGALLDEGLLAGDGSVLVSFAGRDARLAEGASPALLDEVRFFDAAGDLVNVVSEPDLLPMASRLAASGALFVAVRSDSADVMNHSLTAYSPNGVLMWVHPLPADVYLAGTPGLAVSEIGNRVAYLAYDRHTAARQDLRVLDGADGSVVGNFETVGFRVHDLTFSADGSRLAAVSADETRVYSTDPPALLARLAAPAGMAHGEAVFDHDGKRVAISARLHPDTPYPGESQFPDQLLVEVHQLATGATLLTGRVERTDVRSAQAPPVRAAHLEFADDGAYLLAATESGLAVFEVSQGVATP